MTSSTPLGLKIKMAPLAGAHEAGSGRICCKANDDGSYADHSQDGHLKFGWTTMAFRFWPAGAADLMRWTKTAHSHSELRALPRIVARATILAFSVPLEI